MSAFVWAPTALLLSGVPVTYLFVQSVLGVPCGSRLPLTLQWGSCPTLGECPLVSALSPCPACLQAATWVLTVQTAQDPRTSGDTHLPATGLKAPLSCGRCLLSWRASRWSLQGQCRCRGSGSSNGGPPSCPDRGLTGTHCSYSSFPSAPRSVSGTRSHFNSR